MRLSAIMADPPPAAANPVEQVRAIGGRLAELTATLHGIEAYQQAPWRRSLEDHPCLWRIGAAQLRDYGGASGAPAALVIPSLINGPEILDLIPERSFLADLRAAGLRPVLLDWGAPGLEERRFDATDYTIRRILPAYDHVCAAFGPPVLVGYCMGGTLSVATTCAAETPPLGVALIGAPWDFAAMPGAMSLGQDHTDALEALTVMERLYGAAPPDVAQASFALDSLAEGATRFADFSRLADQDPDSESARFFIALQDWLHEGPPVSVPLLRGCLTEWRKERRTTRGLWRVNGISVQPDKISAPLTAFIGLRDRVAPPATCRPGAGTRGRVETFDTGHAGLATGPARVQIAEAIAQMARGV